MCIDFELVCYFDFLIDFIGYYGAVERRVPSHFLNCRLVSVLVTSLIYIDIYIYVYIYIYGLAACPGQVVVPVLF